MTDKDENYFVKVSSPSELRINLLESSKELITVLYDLENFKKLRKEKAEKITLLSNKAKEISSLINKLKIELPKSYTKEKTKQQEKPKKKQKIVKQETVKAVGELQRLQQALEDIEGKLDNLR